MRPNGYCTHIDTSLSSMIHSGKALQTAESTTEQRWQLIAEAKQINDI